MLIKTVTTDINNFLYIYNELLTALIFLNIVCDNYRTKINPQICWFNMPIFLDHSRSTHVLTLQDTMAPVNKTADS